MTPATPVTDRWLTWLTRGRDADSSELRRRSLELLLPIRDQVLDGADLRPGDTVLDVGTGEGLLGIAALERVGPDGTVIFSDASDRVLDVARAAVQELGLLDRARFETADAHDLVPVADASVDAIVLRSVLVYLPDRAAAIRAMARVLRPGGRVSLFEPLNAATLDPTGESFFGYDTSQLREQARAVQAAFGRRQPRESDPMMTLTPAGLVHDFERAGFSHVVARDELTSMAMPPADEHTIKALLHGQPNPQLPTVAQAAREALPGAEAERFLAALTDAARAGRGRRRQAALYLAAHLPPGA